MWIQFLRKQRRGQGSRFTFCCLYDIKLYHSRIYNLLSTLYLISIYLLFLLSILWSSTADLTLSCTLRCAGDCSVSFSLYNILERYKYRFLQNISDLKNNLDRTKNINILLTDSQQVHFRSHMLFLFLAREKLVIPVTLATVFLLNLL